MSFDAPPQTGLDLGPSFVQLVRSPEPRAASAFAAWAVVVAAAVGSRVHSRAFDSPGEPWSLTELAFAFAAFPSEWAAVEPSFVAVDVAVVVVDALN